MESPDWCNLVQDYGDQFDWTISHGPTPSDRTGPHHAFTGRWFAYIEAIILLTATAIATSAAAITLVETIFHCGLLRQVCRLRQGLIHAGMIKLPTVC